MTTTEYLPARRTFATLTAGAERLRLSRGYCLLGHDGDGRFRITDERLARRSAVVVAMQQGYWLAAMGNAAVTVDGAPQQQCWLESGSQLVVDGEAVAVAVETDPARAPAAEVPRPGGPVGEVLAPVLDRNEPSAAAVFEAVARWYVDTRSVPVCYGWLYDGARRDLVVAGGVGPLPDAETTDEARRIFAEGGLVRFTTDDGAVHGAGVRLDVAGLAAGVLSCTRAEADGPFGSDWDERFVEAGVAVSAALARCHEFREPAPLCPEALLERVRGKA